MQQLDIILHSYSPFLYEFLNLRSGKHNVLKNFPPTEARML